MMEIFDDNNQYSFNEDNVEKLSGHVIVPLGLTGSGKSTFIAALVRYLFSTPTLSATLQPPVDADDPGMYQPGINLVNHWQAAWEKGEFVQATQAGVYRARAIPVRVEPLEGETTPLEFTCLELSGEDIQKIVEQGHFPRFIETLFNNDRVNVLLVWIVHPGYPHTTDDQKDPGVQDPLGQDPDPPHPVQSTFEPNDLLFRNIKDYLQTKIPDRAGSMPLLVLIPDPETAFKNWRAKERAGKGRVEGFTTIEGGNCEDYLKEFAPQTRAFFHGWKPRKRAVSPFLIGHVKEGRVIHFDENHTKRIFDWIYHQLTGRKLGPSRWQRFWHSLFT